MGVRQLTARVTAKGELSLPAELFKPHAPPSFMAVGTWNGRVCLYFGSKHRYEKNDPSYRRTYLPAERSTAIRVSVKTELLEAGLNEFDSFLSAFDLEFPIERNEPGYLQIDIRRNQNGKANRKTGSKNGSNRSKA